MVYSEESDYSDCIFDLPHSVNGNTLPTGIHNDHRYNKQIMRVFCFSNLVDREVAYSIIDGVPLKIPANAIGFPAVALMLGDHSKGANPLGVYIIKEYTYTKTYQLVAMLNLWAKGGFDVTDETIDLIRKGIKQFESTQTKKDTLIFRLIEFIPRDELVITKKVVHKPIIHKEEDLRVNKFKSIDPNVTYLSDDTSNNTYSPRFSTFLNGMITLDLDIAYNNKPLTNVIEVELSSKSGKQETHWMVIGDMTIPLTTNFSASSDMLTVKYGGKNVKNIPIDNLSTFDIYDNLDEALQNRKSTSLKQAKLKLEEDKLIFDNKKLILEHRKLKEQIRIQEQTLKIQYNIELIKLLLAKNNLKVNEYTTAKSLIEGGIKIVVAIENLVKKFKS